MLRFWKCLLPKDAPKPQTNCPALESTEGVDVLMRSSHSYLNKQCCCQAQTRNTFSWHLHQSCITRMVRKASYMIIQWPQAILKEETTCKRNQRRWCAINEFYLAFPRLWIVGGTWLACHWMAPNPGFSQLPTTTDFSPNCGRTSNPTTNEKRKNC